MRKPNINQDWKIKRGPQLMRASSKEFNDLVD